MLCLAVTCSLLLGAWARPPGLGDVTEIRTYDHGDYTRVVIQLSREAPYVAHEIRQPPRLYIDIDQTWIDRPLRAAREFDGAAPLRAVRGGQNQLERARVVIELERPGVRRRMFHLQNPFRIVVDVYAGDATRPLPRPAGPLDTFDARKVNRVVIDPGHGGKDPGARGPKMYEKDLVLRIAKGVRKRLEKKGVEVMLTRDDDTFVPLEERTARASRWKADLFVSIHANASRNRRHEGVETYLLDTRYDKQTARVAARENGTTVEQLNELQMILASLRLGYNERYAARLAKDVQKSLVRELRTKHAKTPDLGVKRGPFLVLFMADMPAILVEVGFLSNKRESARMRSKQFPTRAADGIARGILAYRADHARQLLAER